MPFNHFIENGAQSSTRNLRAGYHGLVSTAIILLASSAVAQDIPSIVRPEQFRERLPDGIEQQDDVPTPAAPAEPRVTPAPDGAERISFSLKEITLQGNASLSEEQLQAQYEDMLGKEITVAELYGLADRLTTYYRNEGYTLAQVYVPPQDISDSVNLVVKEGLISSVTLEGDKAEMPLLQEHRDALQKMGVFYQPDIERQILLINDIPGIQAQLMIERDETDEENTFVIRLVINEEAHQHQIFADNYGSRFIGPYEAGFSVGLNQLTGGDSVSFTGLNTGVDELNYGQVSYLRHLNSEGTNLRLQSSYGLSKLGYTLEPQEIEAESFYAQMAVFHPFIRQRQKNLSAGLEVEWKDNSSTAFDQRLYRDEIFTTSLRGQWQSLSPTDGWATADASITRGWGGGGWLESDAPSRAGGENEFTSYNLVMGHTQPLPFEQWSLFTQLQGQYTRDNLLASEEFSIGGAFLGRGYDSGEITGDKGIGGLVELRYDWADFLQGVDTRFYTFYDIGSVWNGDNLSLFKQQSLASAGFGVFFIVHDTVAFNITYAHPLTKPQNTPLYGNEQGPRVLFSVNAGF